MLVCDTWKGNSHHSSPQTKKNILSVSIVCLLLKLPRIHDFQLLRNHLRAVAYSKFANKTFYNFGVMLAISWRAYSPHGLSKVCTVLLGFDAHITHICASLWQGCVRIQEKEMRFNKKIQLFRNPQQRAATHISRRLHKTSNFWIPARSKSFWLILILH